MKYRYCCRLSLPHWSLPSWERGLKFTPVIKASRPQAVAPLVGAWIEIYPDRLHKGLIIVAPLVGAWIEIMLPPPIRKLIASLPSWERGLKSVFHVPLDRQAPVAPLVGAWIEIFLWLHVRVYGCRRSPRGSVD